MDPNLILGWSLIVLGVVLVILSLFQPFFLSLVATPPPGLLKPIIELLKAIIEFFAKASRGRVYLFVGVAMIIAGAWFLVARPIPTQTTRIGNLDCTRVRLDGYSARCGAGLTVLWRHT